MIELSICIPTYNRCEYLKQAVESVIKQLKGDYCEKVEVVISDNCSTDDTDKMISIIEEQYPDVKIVYSKSAENLGADRNFLRVISLASGDYCWFLGSDDMIAEGSLERVLKEIKEKHTIYISDRYNARLQDMEIEGKQRFFKEDVLGNKVFYFKDEKDWDFYLNRCISLGAIFSYLSSIVFDRGKWNSISTEYYNKYIGTAYIHVVVLMLVLKNFPEASVKYLAEPISINREGNDSFFDNDYKRVMLDYNGYIKISNLFEESLLIKNGIREVVRRERNSLNFKILLLTKNDDYQKLINTMRDLGYSKGEIKLIDTLRSCRIISLPLALIFKLKKMIHKKEKM
ncbi:abequosyltransferase [Pseudobutyrivibrio sp. NOR37]|uniref:Glycosyltransferase family 2 protein n=1 Tax=Pseudobutyrivibrio xylanivorans TaxID=185007 RepID=A0A6M0LIC0_PSEXY|nr:MULTISPECIES: glycosyltransferase family 2 protein [Pseudobutyrivibrio]NEX02308.1 glycosyltransferase family 2 protein [Pseudobutyrivibrio xylanivorans]SFR77978.1 abequosyltransferase [Pseudobutyrivibrio sp. NOR37]